jgi:enamine deaminase RidA (YjgF/YER057c/UK114 family)
MARQRLAPVRRSTTIIVKALVNPAWLIEIEAVAAARAR